MLRCPTALDAGQESKPSADSWTHVDAGPDDWHYERRPTFTVTNAASHDGAMLYASSEVVLMCLRMVSAWQPAATAYGARKRPRRVNPRDNVGDGRV